MKSFISQKNIISRCLPNTSTSFTRKKNKLINFQTKLKYYFRSLVNKKKKNFFFLDNDVKKRDLQVNLLPDLWLKIFTILSSYTTNLHLIKKSTQKTKKKSKKFINSSFYPQTISGLFHRGLGIELIK